MSSGQSGRSAPRAALAVRTIEPRGPGIAAAARDLWQYRELFAYFGRRFVQKRYTRTWLGRLWLPLRPLLAFISRALVFGGLIGIATGSVPYAVFFLVGQGAWQLFAEVTYWSTRGLELSVGTLSRLSVPRLIPVLSGVAPSALDYLIYLVMTAGVVAWYSVTDGVLHLALGPRTLYAVIGLGMLVALGLGIGLWTSTFAVLARDVRFSLGYVLSLWYFFTPVIYPFEAFPPQYRTVASVNPAVAPIELVKVGLLGEGHLTMMALLVTSGTILVLWISGLWFFGRRAADVIDVP